MSRTPFTRLSVHAANSSTDRVQVQGHRGACGIAPENTLASFQLALDLGVDMIELDVRPTRDGMLVVMHDPTVDRTTDGRGPVHDLTLAELQRLNAAARFTGDRDYGRQEGPTLQEVYDLVRGRCPINIEITLPTDEGGHYPGIEEQVVDFVERNHAVSDSVVSSADLASLAEVRLLQPRLAVQGVIWKPHFDAYAQYGWGAPEITEDLVARHLKWVAVQHPYLTCEFVERMHAAGIAVCVWTVNTLQELEKFVAMTVDWVTTDRPDVYLPAVH
jgi:glycerophosphoryl diester phosphodiesterase